MGHISRKSFEQSVERVTTDPGTTTNACLTHRISASLEATPCGFLQRKEFHVHSFLLGKTNRSKHKTNTAGLGWSESALCRESILEGKTSGHGSRDPHVGAYTRPSFV